MARPQAIVKDRGGWIRQYMPTAIGTTPLVTVTAGSGNVVVAARTDPSKGAKGISLFAVERGMEGFENGRKLDKVGQPEADTAELFFNGIRIGFLGEVHPKVLRNWKIKMPVALFEIGLEELFSRLI